MSIQKYIEQFIHFGSLLYERGYSAGGAGNISQRLPDGNIMITPTGSCLGRLLQEDLSIVSIDGNLISGKKPSKELGLHLATYRVKNTCEAIVHLHAPYATALASMADVDVNNVLLPFTPYYVMRVGRLPLVPYFRPGSEELFATIGEYIKDVNAVLLANHGMVMCGKNLADAISRTEELEETARLYFILQSSGKPIRYLSQDEVANLIQSVV